MWHPSSTPSDVFVVVSFLLVVCPLNAIEDVPKGDSPGVSASLGFADVAQNGWRVQPRIASGEEAPLGRFPYMCSIRKRSSGNHMCGGALIHPEWVLTAAHCIDQKASRKADTRPVIYCGIHEVRTPDDDKYIFNTVHSVIHPDWKHKVQRGYDIALLRLDRPAPFEPVAYDNKGEKFDTGEFLVAAGWGQTEKGTAKVLRVAQKLLYQSPKNCKKFISFEFQKHWICAGMDGQDTCKGDSGGPLLSAFAPDGNLTAGSASSDLLVGITSFGPSQKCDGSSPGVYIRVYDFADWIVDTVGTYVAPSVKPAVAVEDPPKSAAPSPETKVQPEIGPDIPEVAPSAIPSSSELADIVAVMRQYPQVFPGGAVWSPQLSPASSSTNAPSAWRRALLTREAHYSPPYPDKLPSKDEVDAAGL